MKKLDKYIFEYNELSKKFLKIAKEMDTVRKKAIDECNKDITHDRSVN